jgi:cobalt ECF transporter T component CbiQ
VQIVTWLISKANRLYRRRSRGFIERTISGFLTVAQDSLFAERVHQSAGFLQRLDARVKLAGIGALVFAAIAVHRLEILAVLFGLTVLLALLSQLSLLMLCKRVWIACLTLTGTVALPSLFLVPGRAAFRLPLLDWPVTVQGLTSAGLLLLRAETAATLSLLLILCTPWNRLLRGLRFFRVPATLVLILEMVHRYIFLLITVVRDMLEARQARRVGDIQPADQRRLAAATVGVLLYKSLGLSEEVYAAMRARGYRGDVYLIQDLAFTSRDWIHLASLLTVASLLIWWGR